MKVTSLAAVACAFVFVLATAVSSLAASSSGARLLASWYGPGFYGHRLCDGTILTPSSRIVASRSMRCGTRITVCFRRCVRARVADYGPAAWTGRSIDLGAGVARAIGFGGVAVVTVYR